MHRLSPVAAAAVLLSLAAAADAQTRPVQLRMDTGTFRYDDERSLAEVYFSVGAASLRYTRTDAGAYEAALPVRLTIRPAADSAPAGAQQDAAFEETIDFRFTVADTSALGDGQVFTEQVRAALVPGEYEVAASAATSGVEARVDLTVPDYATATGVTLSSVQLARRIVRSQDPAAPFVKNGRIVQPYPDAFYGGDLSRVTFYAEVYGLPTEPAEYTLLTYLSESSRPTPVEGTQSRTTRPVQPVDVLVGAVDVRALPTGEYTLHVAVLDAANEAVAERTKRVFVINPDVARPEATVAEAQDDELLYLAMGEEELALNIDHARVLANSRERQQIGGLTTDDDRRAFLVRFWRSRNERAGSPGGDARRTFYERLSRVDDQYRFASSAGYETDRGRVYLTYGPPSGIDRQAFNADSAPFEVWAYENVPGEGRSQFVFVDRYNSGQLELVHSNVTGEVSLPNWQEEILNR